jgi:hypothetical protein
MSAQERLDAVIVAASRLLTSPDIGFRSPVTGRPVCCRDSRRGPNRFEVGGATPQTAVICRGQALQFWAAELRRAFARR